MDKVIFFDLGSTLILPMGPWPPVFDRADSVLRRQLAASGIKLDRKSDYRGHKTLLDLYYANRGNDQVEHTTFNLLKKILFEHQYNDVPDKMLRSALDDMYSVTQGNWILDEQAKVVLEELQRQGHRLGIISNASDDRNVQQLVDQRGLRPFFPFIITSAKCGFRKPHPRIFQIALDFFSIQPSNAVMIGDTLEADILGGNSMGIHTIWITRQTDIDCTDITPGAVIRNLREIPSIPGIR